MLNNMNLIFLLNLLFSTSLTISASSWLGMWMGLELNMISFIPLFLKKKNILMTESCIKYFLIQAIASSTFLMMCLISSFSSLMYSFITPYISSMLIMPLLLKLGASPFQNWFINIMEGLNWFKCYILMTWQKIAPLIIIFYFTNKTLILFFAILSMMKGALGGLNQTSMKKIMAYSSINHLGWLLSATLMNKYFLMLYFLFYMFLNFMVLINLNNYSQTLNQCILQNNFMYLSLSLLSLGGLPPFLGFLPKWMLIQLTMSKILILSLFMISMTLITLLFYLRIVYSSMTILSFKPKWSMMYKNNFMWMVNTLLMILTLLYLMLFNLT